MTIAVVGVPAFSGMQVGAAAGRPSSPAVGQEYLNTDTGYVEVYLSGAWSLPVGAVVGIYKSADTSRASTTTLTDDPHLKVVITTPGTWFLDMVLCVTSDASGKGLKHQLAYTGTATTNLMIRGVGDGGAAGSQATLLNTPTTYSNGALTLTYTGAIVLTSAGTLSLQWAQGSSGVTAVILGSGSHMRATRIA